MEEKISYDIGEEVIFKLREFLEPVKKEMQEKKSNEEES